MPNSGEPVISNNQGAYDKVSLREYFEQSLRNLERANALAAANTEHTLLAMSQATNLASNLMDKRLESMNEFRAQLKDQVATFVTKEQFDALLRRIEQDVKELQLSKANLEGKASQSSVMIVTAISFIGIAIGIINLIITLIGIR